MRGAPGGDPRITHPLTVLGHRHPGDGRPWTRQRAQSSFMAWTSLPPTTYTTPFHEAETVVRFAAAVSPSPGGGGPAGGVRRVPDPLPRARPPLRHPRPPTG